MWQFILGFGTGAYFATYYNLKPAIQKIEVYVRSNFPDKKEEEKEENKKSWF